MTVGAFYSDGVIAEGSAGEFDACPSLGAYSDGVGTTKGFTGWPRKAYPTLAPVPSPYAVA